ncbi:alpha-L-fucosidase [Butyricimonas hominis]|uniref:alpha-L-fucosidase n=2 Tax=Odoribacteraceae TaxID=1853231 RepID=UPI001D082B16|nr:MULTISPECIES: alpha-L-fucosidase [Butyricimonas]MCB6971157.1 alpha-L-fucosidase [Butyricimonas synergistica]MCG4517871.1 alpha-L-fucosidase [Butyricimonas sp. DFI.6.44]
MKRLLIILFLGMISIQFMYAQDKSLYQLQQEFVDLRFGMFIHFNMPTYFNEDWPDPDASPALFNPTKLDCKQWAKAARSANMTYGCLTTKHHSGFCIWETKTTDYSVTNSPFKRDVVKEYADAFRAEGLKVMLYYSILDMHARLRPHCITPEHVEMIKEQIRELLTNYGEITALIIDGWDAPWSRISYDEVPFEDIYCLVKSLQPHCLVMDLNAAKYPAEVLFYTDIKSYEQGAGQHISKETNRLPALSCLPLQANWFWKEGFPSTAVKNPERMVNENIIPMGKVYCNFILNVAPNRDGLMDANALKALKEIGKLWKNDGQVAILPETEEPIISSNIAKFKPAEGSWSSDYAIMDFANDDNFGTCWNSNPEVKTPWFTVAFEREQPFNMVVVTERNNDCMQEYRVEYRVNGVWKTIYEGKALVSSRVKIHRFDTVWGDAVRITVLKSNGTLSIAEFGVYCERCRF